MSPFVFIGSIAVCAGLVWSAWVIGRIQGESEGYSRGYADGRERGYLEGRRDAR